MFAGLLGARGATDRLGADRRRLGAGLLTLEINTIIKQGITAERMPVLPHALLDIVMEYSGLLLASPGLETADLRQFLLGGEKAQLVVPAAGIVAGDAVAAPAETPDAARAALRALRQDLRPNLQTFSGLRQAAITALNLTDAAIAAGSTLRPRDAGQELPRRSVLLNRVVNNIETVQDVLKRLTDAKLIADLQLSREQLSSKFDPRLPAGTPDEKRLLVLGPYEVPPSDYLAIRKVWAVGIEEIVAQTAISLDGDIVTRITPLLLRAEGKPLLEIHERAVNTSVAYWKGLVDTLLMVIDRAISTFFGGRR